MPSTKKAADQQSGTRKDALLLFKLIHDEAISEDARHHLLEYVDDILNSAPLTDAAHNKPLFLRGFVDGWQRSDSHSRRNVGEILGRVKAGETLEQVLDDFNAQLQRSVAVQRAAWLTMPQPKDRNSDEWRYWKLRRLEDALQGNDIEASEQAWKEFKTLLTGLMAEGGFWYTGNAVALLPHLLIVRQEIDRAKASERPSQGMKGGLRRRQKKS
jgi:hypothetical protein